MIMDNICELCGRKRSWPTLIIPYLPVSPRFFSLRAHTVTPSLAMVHIPFFQDTLSIFVCNIAVFPFTLTMPHSCLTPRRSTPATDVKGAFLLFSLPIYLA
jgi:hypothetical protein